MTVLSRKRERQWHTPGLRARLVIVAQLGRDLITQCPIGFAQLALAECKGFLDDTL